MDVRCQKLIERTLRSAFPEVAVLGEEGDAGQADAPYRWVVDPIDGTVNFSYGIPHACVSIALQRKTQKQNTKRRTQKPGISEHQTLVGVVYDPFCDELWTGIRGQPARLNGKIIHVSRRRDLAETLISIGFAKSRESLEDTLPYFNQLVRRVRKIRMMGAAALALTYVATGRFDAYIERGIRLWDIAAGGLIVECAGGEDAPDSADGVNGDSAGRVVDLPGEIDVNCGQGHDDPGNSTDEHGPNVERVGRGGDGDQRGEKSHDHQMHVGFSVAEIAEEQAGRPTGGGGEEDVAGRFQEIIADGS